MDWYKQFSDSKKTFQYSREGLKENRSLLQREARRHYVKAKSQQINSKNH